MHLHKNNKDLHNMKNKVPMAKSATKNVFKNNPVSRKTPTK